MGCLLEPSSSGFCQKENLLWVGDFLESNVLSHRVRREREMLASGAWPSSFALKATLVLEHIEMGTY